MSHPCDTCLGRGEFVAPSSRYGAPSKCPDCGGSGNEPVSFRMVKVEDRDAAVVAERERIFAVLEADLRKWRDACARGAWKKDDVAETVLLCADQVDHLIRGLRCPRGAADGGSR